jgi:DNA-3-methyladenine glycosylase
MECIHIDAALTPPTAGHSITPRAEINSAPTKYLIRKKLKRNFYNQPTLKVAKKLLGKYLVVKKGKGLLSGKIVETEAYVGKNDPASHAYKGITPRNKIMFGKPGFAYIYLTYGMYHCLNFITEKEGFPAAVLIRALEPKEGIEAMMRNRKISEVKNLTNGPGKLCQALGLDRSLNGADLCSKKQKKIWVKDRKEKPGKIVSTSRIGIDEGRDKKWRFYIEGNRFVSKK